MSSFSRLRQSIALKSVPHVHHDYFFLVQPIISLIWGVAVVVLSSFLKLAIRELKLLQLHKSTIIMYHKLNEEK